MMPDLAEDDSMPVHVMMKLCWLVRAAGSPSQQAPLMHEALPSDTGLYDTWPSMAKRTALTDIRRTLWLLLLLLRPLAIKLPKALHNGFMTWRSTLPTNNAQVLGNLAAMVVYGRAVRSV
jgi:hypothetical protein